ncbi:MAG: VCBS domain-containing protein [Desulfovibrio sp.]|nr:VCBS domain-containing protein [Desulfovibrio sp.]
MRIVNITRPTAAQQSLVPAEADARITLNFPANEATLERSGDDLMFRFDDGASVRIENFYTQYNKDTAPEFEVDGQLVNSADFFAAMGPDLMPAAGPSSAATRDNHYNEYSNSALQVGIDHLGALDYGFAMGAVTSEDYYGGPLNQAPILSTNSESITLSLKESGWVKTPSGSFVPEPGVAVVNGSFSVHDPDGDTLSASIVINGASYAINTTGPTTVTTEYGTFVITPSNAGSNVTYNFTYTLNNDDYGATDSLKEGEIHTDKIVVSVTDGINPVKNQPINIVIEGTNDAPDIIRVDDVTLKEDGVFAGSYGEHDTTNALDPAENAVTQAGGTAADQHRTSIEGQIVARDPDHDSVLTYGLTDNTGNELSLGGVVGFVDGIQPVVIMDIETDPANPNITIYHTVYGDLSLDTSTGQYQFTLVDTEAGGKTNALSEGQKVHLQFKPSVEDEHGLHDFDVNHLRNGSTPVDGDNTIDVNILGTNDRPVFSDDAAHWNNAQLLPDKQGVDHESIKESGAPNDNSGVNDNVSVSGTITATDYDNDAVLRYGFKIATPSGQQMVNTLYVVSDGADGYVLLTEADFLALGTTDYYGKLEITDNSAFNSGTYTFTLKNSSECVQAMDEGDTLLVELEVVVKDEYGAWSDIPLELQIVGANDAPFFTEGSQGTVKESGVYAPDNSALFPNLVENTLTTDVGNGDLATDASRNEQHKLTLTGQVKADDVDLDDKGNLTFGMSNSLGITFDAAPDGSTTVYYLANGSVTDQTPGNNDYYGTLTMNADGTYTFVLNNATGSPADKMSEGEQKVITFSPSVSDGQATSVGGGEIVVTIIGSNDIPDLSIAHDNTSLTGDVGGIFNDNKTVQQATGKLTVSDMDTLDMTQGHDIKAESTNTGDQGVDLASSSSDNTIKINGEYGNLYITRTSSGSDHTDDTYTYRYVIDPIRAAAVGKNEVGKEDFTVTIRDQFGAYDEKQLVFEVIGSDDPTNIGLSNGRALVVESGVTPAGQIRVTATQDAVYKAQYQNEENGQPETKGDLYAHDVDKSDQAALNNPGVDANMHYVIVDNNGTLHDVNKLMSGQSSIEIQLKYGKLIIERTKADGETDDSAPFKYTYELDNDNHDVQELNFNEKLDDNFVVQVYETDGSNEITGTPVSQVPTGVIVQGTNDRPIIDISTLDLSMEEHYGNNTGSQFDSGGRVLKGQIAITDYEDAGTYDDASNTWQSEYVNSGAGFTFSLVNLLPGKSVDNADLRGDDLSDEANFDLKSDAFVLQGKYGVLEIDPQTGEFTYTRTNDLTWLNNGESTEDTFYVRVKDPNGAYSEVKPIVITINGNDDPGVLTGNHADMKEDGVDGSDLPGETHYLHYDGTSNDHGHTEHLGANHPNNGNPASFVVNGQLGVRDPDTSDSPASGSGASDAYTYGNPTTTVPGGATDDGADIGKVSEATANSNGSFEYTIHGYGTLTLWPDGKYTFEPLMDGDDLAAPINNLAVGESVVITVPVTVTGSGVNHTGETTKGNLVVIINGTNDAPIVTSETQGSVEVTYTNQLTKEELTSKLTLDQRNGEAVVVDSDEMAHWDAAKGGNITVNGSLNSEKIIKDVDHGDQSGLTFFTVDGTATTGEAQGNLVQQIEGKYGTLIIQRDGSYQYLLDKSGTAYKDMIAAKPEGIEEEIFNIYVRDPHNATSEEPIKLVIKVAAPDADHGGGDPGNPDPNPTNPGSGGNQPGKGIDDQHSLVKEDVNYTATGKVGGDNYYDSALKLTGYTSSAGDASLHNSDNVIVTKYGTISLMPDGSYTYTLNNDHPDVQKLREDDEIKQKFTFTDKDGTSKVVEIIIQGTNDLPFVVSSSDGSLTQQSGGTWVSVSATGSFEAKDLDDGERENLVLKGSNVTSTGPDTYTVQGQYGVYTITKTVLNGNSHFEYTYDLNSAYYTPNFGGQVSDPVTVDISDGKSSIQHTVNVEISAQNDNPIISKAKDLTVSEDNKSISDTTKVEATDPDIAIVSTGPADNLTYTVANADGSGEGSMIVGKYGVLVMGADGSYYFKLNNSHPDVQALNGADPNDPSSRPESIDEKYRVIVRDGKGGVDYKEITVVIEGSDDVPTLYLYGANAALEATGPAGAGALLVVKDKQGGTEADYTVHGKAQGYDTDQADYDTLTYSIKDNGSNVASVDIHAIKTATGWEITSGLTPGAVHMGTLSINGSTGLYTFKGDPKGVANLGLGEEINIPGTIVVYDSHGNEASADMNINIMGTNTAPIIVSTGDKTPDYSTVPLDKNEFDIAQSSSGTYAPLTGEIVTEDADGDETIVYIRTTDPILGERNVTELTGKYGKLILTVGDDGKTHYEYIVTNSGSIRALGEGETDKDIFNLIVRDPYGAEGSGSLVIDIIGANDAPKISIDESARTIAVTDPDKNDSHTLTIVVDGTDYALTVDPLDPTLFSCDLPDGTLTLRYEKMPNGEKQWTYSFEPDASLASGLPSNKYNEFDFSVKVEDQHGARDASGDATVRYYGTNHAPVGQHVALTAILSGVIPAESEFSFGDNPLALLDQDGDHLNYTFTDSTGADVAVSGTATTIAGEFGTLEIITNTSGDGYVYNYTTTTDMTAMKKLAQMYANGEELKDEFLYTVNDGIWLDSESGKVEIHLDVNNLPSGSFGDASETNAQVIFGTAGDDILLGGLGNDILSGGEGNNSLHGGLGNDSLFGGTGNDYLDGGTGANELYGGAGNDVLVFSASNTAMDGGAGIDMMVGADKDSLESLFSNPATNTIKSIEIFVIDGGESLTSLASLKTYGVQLNGSEKIELSSDWAVNNAETPSSMSGDYVAFTSDNMTILISKTALAEGII